MVELQKELSRRQLAQYKKQEEAEAREKEMLSRPAFPIGPTNVHSMMTRVMFRQKENIPMQNLNRIPTPINGSMENVSLSIPRNNNFSLGGSTRGSLNGSCDGSLNNLAHEPVPFNRMGGTPASGENLSLNSPSISRIAPGSSFRGTTYNNLSSGEEISLHSMRGGNGSGSSNTLFENSMYGLNRSRNRGVDPAQLTRRLEPFAGDLDITHSTPNLSGGQVYYRAGDQEITFRGPQTRRLQESPPIEIPHGGYMPLVGGRLPTIRDIYSCNSKT